MRCLCVGAHTVKNIPGCRRNQAEFLAKGFASLEEAKRSDEYVDADVVVDKLRQRLAMAKAQLAQGH